MNQTDFHFDVQQQQVIAHRGGPLLVLGGPGSGKTRTLAAAAAASQNPTHTLVLVFNREAVADFSRQVALFVGSGPLPRVSTFHSVCREIVQEFAAQALTGTVQGDMPSLRLLSGPEQEQRVAELLAVPEADRRVRWPQEAHEALTTATFAEEVRRMISRARGIGMDPADLADLAQHAGEPLWGAAAQFLEEYLQVLDAAGEIDYTELVVRATLLAEQPEIGEQLRQRWQTIYVDEYQDTDPMFARLLRAVTHPGSTFVVAGDPDQAMYSFRGADARAMREFRRQFAPPGQEYASQLVLPHNYRLSVDRAKAAAHILGAAVPTGLSHVEVQQLREPGSTINQPDPVVLTFDHAADQAAHIADLVRRLHVVEGVSWSDIALVVRSKTLDYDLVVQALLDVRIPVQGHQEDVPLAEHPIVQLLLQVGRLAQQYAQLSVTDKSATSARKSADMSEPEYSIEWPLPVTELLTSPLGLADPADVRTLAGWLPGSLEQAFITPEVLQTLPRGVSHNSAGVALTALSALVVKVAEQIQSQRPGAEVLWQIWNSTGWQTKSVGESWPERLQNAALAGDWAAHVELDAVCALFDYAARNTRLSGGVLPFGALAADLSSQRVALAAQEHTPRPGGAVEILTAHRTKGRQWPVVVLVGVQEGSWPNQRMHASFLGAERVEWEELHTPQGLRQRLAEERRLFYIATSRARGQLFLTAVEDEEADATPSRFLVEFCEAAHLEPTVVSGPPAHPLSLSALIGHMRQVLQDPMTSSAMQMATARELQRISELDYFGDESAAAPEQWWGALDVTHAAAPVCPADAPLRLASSELDTLKQCALRWFLSRNVRAGRPRSQAQQVGTLVHEFAQANAQRLLAGRGAFSEAEMHEWLASRWQTAGYEAQWQQEQEREETTGMLAAILRRDEQEHEHLLATETPFEMQWELLAEDGASKTVQIRGTIDRIEAIDDGEALRIIDFKTGHAVKTQSEVETDLQLATYQRAVQEQALTQPHPWQHLPVAQAQLLYVRPAASGKNITLRTQSALDAPAENTAEQTDPLKQLLSGFSVTIEQEDFAPTPGSWCRTCDFQQICPAQRGREVS